MVQKKLKDISWPNMGGDVHTTLCYIAHSFHVYSIFNQCLHKIIYTLHVVAQYENPGES